MAELCPGQGLAGREQGQEQGNRYSNHGRLHADRKETQTTFYWVRIDGLRRVVRARGQWCMRGAPETAQRGFWFLRETRSDRRDPARIPIAPASSRSRAPDRGCTWFDSGTTTFRRPSVSRNAARALTSGNSKLTAARVPTRAGPDQCRRAYAPLFSVESAHSCRRPRAPGGSRCVRRCRLE